MIWMRIVFALIFLSSAIAAPLKLRVVDASGAPFAKVLVIVRSLEGGGEITRDLTDANGRVPEIDLRNGLYQVIATCPYGLCDTVVREFLGGRTTGEILITVPVKPSDTEGMLLGSPRVRTVLKLPNRSIASGVHLLVRDLKAKREKWYVTDEHGAAIIELLDDPVQLVAIHDEAVFTLQLETGCSQGTNGLKCSRLDLTQDLIWQLR
jgi:hypothetical protein